MGSRRPGEDAVAGAGWLEPLTSGTIQQRNTPEGYRPMPVQLLVLVLALPYMGYVVYAVGRPAHQPPATSEAADSAVDEWGFR